VLKTGFTTLIFVFLEEGGLSKGSNYGTLIRQPIRVFYEDFFCFWYSLEAVGFRQKPLNIWIYSDVRGWAP
jgi:hypothetical protein